LKAIGSGSILARLLCSMVEPPFFWDSLIKSFTGGLLNRETSNAFAWLLLQLVSLPGKASLPYLVVANSSDVLDQILKSPDGETRILGQKIKNILPLNATELYQDTEAKSGGRHDNDHADYRQISIMPTADELLSKDRPFFRAADCIDDPQIVPSRHAIHLDNQFRLLREDMLGEIRDELKSMTKAKTSCHKGVIVGGLSLAGVEMGSDRKRLPWSLVLKCTADLPHLRGINPDKRLRYLKDNRHILRHGNMACLLIDGEPAAFPTIYRDEAKLIQNPASIIIQLPDDSTLPYALSKMKTSRDIKLMQLESAIFAFEPFLKRLQEMKDLPLSNELLDWKSGQDINCSSFQPTKVIEAIELLSGSDLKDILRVQKSIILDKSQTRSLCTSLRQRVSLVQGPPGEQNHLIRFILTSK
jgi:hypothetical protein